MFDKYDYHDDCKEAIFRDGIPKTRRSHRKYPEPRGITSKKKEDLLELNKYLIPEQHHPGVLRVVEGKRRKR